ncbi:MAG: response regulator [Candidatus Latescibacterota bacterium]|jgi:two-component system chemotaxis sensor kinase CheA
MGKQDEFLKRLLATFKVEAEEHLQAISSGLFELEKAPDAARQAQIIETVFREAHSLKGAARSVDLAEVEAICQALESVLAASKRLDLAWSPALSELLHQAVKGLEGLLSSSAPEKPRMRELIQALEQAAKGGKPATQREERDRQPPENATEGRLLAEERPALAETVRIPAARLDALLLQVEELIAAKLSARQRVLELGDAKTACAAWRKEWARVGPQVRIRQPSPAGNGAGDPPAGEAEKLLEFVEWTSSHLGSLESRLAALAASAGLEARSLATRVDALLEDVKRVLMLPFSTLLEPLPRYVRELAREQGKDIELVVQGGELEIDRRILEEMKDPFLHLVRNCVDHGIERPEERERRNKPPRGRVTIAASPRNGDKVEILLADDGAGIDVAGLRAAALKLGTITPEEVGKLSDQEALSLMLRSGVSTSPLITSVSGRGLGLAIVQEKVERLGGRLSFETHPGAGTSFRMVLPLTLATFRGVLVRAGEQLLILPTASVERAVRVGKEVIKTVENRETLALDGQPVSLVRLAVVLELPERGVNAGAPDTVHVVVLAFGGRRIAFAVDEVLGEQEVLAKSLGRQLSRVRNVSGATVLGTGKVVPILNVPDLMKSAVRASGAAARPPAVPAEGEKTRRRSVLVVEDSITARTLLKSILETAGYEVRTAVDGVDGFTQLRSSAFDLVVSDVDMPRMSGFDLTARIRGDRKLAELPVVLVTALESREDRERGMDVGANAYLVKSSFDQSNLVEVIQRLI